MIVVAELDLSESGRKPGLPEVAKVLVYADNDHDLIDALAAINAVRLIREGHVYTTEIKHSVDRIIAPIYDWVLDNTGEVIGR